MQAVFLVWCECPCGATRIGQREGALFPICQTCGEYAACPTPSSGEQRFGIVGELRDEQEAFKAATDAGYRGRIDGNGEPRLYRREAVAR